MRDCNGFVLLLVIMTTDHLHVLETIDIRPPPIRDQLLGFRREGIGVVTFLRKKAVESKIEPTNRSKSRIGQNQESNPGPSGFQLRVLPTEPQ